MKIKKTVISSFGESSSSFRPGVKTLFHKVSFFLRHTVFFSKFNLGDNHVFDFYPSFVGKPDIRGKHQKYLQNVANFVTIILHYLFIL